jgi:hypothetical protein
MESPDTVQTVLEEIEELRAKIHLKGIPYIIIKCYKKVFIEIQINIKLN